MSKGLGRTQRAILVELASHPDGLCTADLLPLPGGDETSNIRGVLQSLKRRGLAASPGYFAGTRGRPSIWVITDAGRRQIGADGPQDASDGPGAS